jgi:hypothetical protein
MIDDKPDGNTDEMECKHPGDLQGLVININYIAWKEKWTPHDCLKSGKALAGS